jgi:hypothetical protein
MQCICTVVDRTKIACNSLTGHEIEIKFLEKKIISYMYKEHLLY